MEMWKLLTLITLIAWGIWGIASKLATNSIAPKQALLFQCVGVMAFSVVVLVVEGFKVQWNAPGFSWAFVAGFCAFVGFLTYLAALEKGSTSVVVMISALYPLVTIVLSVIFLHERLNIRQGFGILLAIVAAVILSL